jgi:hypothetical protein
MVGTELIGNVPNTTPEASWACSMVMLFTLLRT